MKTRMTSGSPGWKENIAANVRGKLRGNPARWAGIAAAAGLGAGLLGRLLRHRARRRRGPTIVIIEAAR
jgi:hypothetical protein